MPVDTTTTLAAEIDARAHALLRQGGTASWSVGQRVTLAERAERALWNAETAEITACEIRTHHAAAVARHALRHAADLRCHAGRCLTRARAWRAIAAECAA